MSCLQDNVLVRDWRTGTDRVLWHGRIRPESGGQPRSQPARQRDRGRFDWQTVLDWREAQMYRLSDTGWRKHEGNTQCYACLQCTINGAIFFLNLFVFIILQFLQLSEMPSPFSVAVFNDVVYWSDTRRRAIQGANKLTGKNRRVYLKRPGQPFDLKVRIHTVHFTKCLMHQHIFHYWVFSLSVLVQVVHPLLQPNVSSPCEKLRCSRVCLLTSGLKAVCRCPTGFLLAVDGFTCTPPVDSSSSFLMLLSPTVITQVLHFRRVNEWLLMTL